MASYLYRGDRWTDPQLKGAAVEGVQQANGKCVRGRNGNMLVTFGGRRVVVVGRQLRKVQ